MADKTNIIETRTGGLGSSDAKMIARIGTLGEIPDSAKKRIAIMLGLDKPLQFGTDATSKGNYIEDCVFQMLNDTYPNAVSNPYYKSEYLSEKYGFDVFNHIDFEVVKNGTLFWFENKATNHESQETMNEYCDQMDFHFILGAEKAQKLGLDFKLYMVHYFTGSECKDFDSTNISQIGYNARPSYLFKGLQIISDGIKNFEYDKKEELSAFDLPEKIQDIISELSVKMQQIKDVESEVEQFKEKMLDLMQKNNVKSIKNDYFNMTVVEATIAVLFDKDKFKKDMPETFEKYNTKKSNNKSFIKITLKN